MRVHTMSIEVKSPALIVVIYRSMKIIENEIEPRNRNIALQGSSC